MKKYFVHRLGQNRWGDEVLLYWRRGESLVVISRPREGKDAQVKPLIVKASRERYVLDMDYKGEHKEHITKPNTDPNCEFPDKVRSYDTLENYTFRLSQFDQPYDWVALGFESEYADIMARLAVEGIGYYNDDPEKFSDLVSKIPIREKGNALDNFAMETGVTLKRPLNYNTVNGLWQRFERIRKWFYQGKSDRRRVITEVTERDWKEKVLIVNLTDTTFTGTYRTTSTEMATAWSGKLCQLMAKLIAKYRPIIVFNESNALLGGERETSIVRFVAQMVGAGPKTGVQFIFLLHSLGEMHRSIYPNMRAQKIVGKLDFGDEQFLRISRQLESAKHEFCLIDSDGKERYYYADVPCCKFESDL